MKTEAQKLKRISFTMHPEYIKMLSDLARKNSGTSMSHEVRRLINEKWNKEFDKEQNIPGSYR